MEDGLERFAATPTRYPGLPDLLRRAKPAPPKKRASLFTTHEEAWLQDNDAEEEARQELKGAADAPDGRGPQAAGGTRRKARRTPGLGVG